MTTITNQQLSYLYTNIYQTPKNNQNAPCAPSN